MGIDAKRPVVDRIGDAQGVKKPLARLRELRVEIRLQLCELKAGVDLQPWIANRAREGLGLVQMAPCV